MKLQKGITKYLKQQSEDICKMNECTEDNHNCESYAYFDRSGNLLDICCPDYFQGSSGQVVAIPLPFIGTLKDLKSDIQFDLAF